jgi:hypothetical protein
MAIVFPALKPSSYSFTPAVYNVTAPKFLNSTFSPRLNSSKPNASILTLNYTNISAAKILSIFSAWDSSYSGFFPLTLPPEVVAGIKSTDFSGRIVGPKSKGWRFSSEPILSNMRVGVGDVAVELVGELYLPDVKDTSVILHLPLTSATGFTDVSRRSVSVAPGNVSISTTVGRWGSSSAFFSGATGAWMSVALADIIGTSDYTIEFWFRKSSYVSNKGLFYFYNSINASNLFIPRDSFTLWGAMASNAVRSDGHGDTRLYNGTTNVPLDNTWAFFQQTRSNGVATTTINAGNVQSKSYGSGINETLLAIGTYDTTSRLWIGNINDFRVSLVARPHDVPTEPLPIS